MLYITHTCKDKTCSKGFVDKDLTRAMRPPVWKYCPECVNKGKKNPEHPPKNEGRSAAGKKRGQRKEQMGCHQMEESWMLRGW